MRRLPLTFVALAMGVMASILPQRTLAATAFPAFEVTGTGAFSASWAVTGFTFRPNVDIWVTAIGVFDGPSNGVGLARGYTAGIVALDDTVLGQAVIPSGVVAPLEAPFDSGGLQAGGGFRYAAFDSGAVALSANTVYAAAVVVPPGGSDPIPLSPLTAVDPAITFITRAADCCGAENNTLRLPDEFVFSDLFVNFRFSTTPVPLPAALPLLLSALAAVGIFSARRRRA